MNREKAIERVKKLLAMAKDTSSPEEAAIAARRARALMDKFQLDKGEMMEFVESDFGVKAPWEVYGTQVPQFKQFLATALAKYNDCIAAIAIVPTTGAYELQFKGYEVDAICAATMFDYLVDAIEYHLKRAKAEKRVKGRRAFYDFRLGATLALTERIREMTRQREVEVGTTALMVSKKGMVTQVFGQADYAKKTVNSGSAEFNQGKEAGRKIGLNKQLDGEKVVDASSRAMPGAAHRKRLS